MATKGQALPKGYYSPKRRTNASSEPCPDYGKRRPIQPQAKNQMGPQALQPGPCRMRSS